MTDKEKAALKKKLAGLNKEQRAKMAKLVPAFWAMYEAFNPPKDKGSEYEKKKPANNKR